MILQHRYHHYEPTVGTKALLQKNPDHVVIMECTGSQLTTNSWECITNDPTLYFTTEVRKCPIGTEWDMDLNDPRFDVVKAKL